MSIFPQRALAAGAAAIVAVIGLPAAASAQLIFDWGGQEKVNDSGRQAVRISADAKPGEIIVSFSDRKLYLITAPGQALSYPIAIPREQDRWEGRTTVTQKRENPSWTPTPSMLKENPKLPRWVPGGHPMNPLGNRALYLGSSFYRIHGTDAPWTIGTAVSKGCIRMYNKDALDVYERAKVGAKVLVTWKNYQAKPDGEQPQTAAREEAPAAARANAPAAAATVPTAAPATAPAAAASAGRRQPQESRYSDIFGTPEPPAAAKAVEPADQQAPTPTTRPTRGRETQPQQREPRRSREAATERTRTDSAASPGSPSAAVVPSTRSSTSEPRQRPAAVETGSIQERRPRAKATVPAAEDTAQVAQPAREAQSPDAAQRALEAAERAAAAAERAAAAAERAEKAAVARAAAQTPATTPSSAPAAGTAD